MQYKFCSEYIPSITRGGAFRHHCGRLLQSTDKTNVVRILALDED